MSNPQIPPIDAFMPHGMCYLWQPGILVLHVVCDAVIALAYCSIPITLLHFVHKRRDFQFHWVLALFALFIVACGATHLMEIWTVWHPTYWLSGGVKAVTAAASAGTAVLLVKMIPHALRVPSPAALEAANGQLEREIAERRSVEESLRRANETLEARVAERAGQLQAVNRTLIRENARFALAADAAGLGFWTLRTGTDDLQWDEGMFRLYGHPVGAGVAGKIWTQTLHPDDRERCERELEAAIDAPYASYDTEYHILRRDGGVRCLRSVARVLRDDRGQVTGMHGVAFDVTDLKRANEQFRLAMEAAPTGMLLMDAQGSIVLVNAQIEKLFGYSRADMMGRQVEMLLPERYRHRHPELRKEFFADPQTRSMAAGRELHGMRKDGSEVPIEIGLTPLHAAAGNFVLASIVDLTSRREMEQMRTDFVSTVSHELRTPLTSINGSLSLLESGVVGTLSSQAAAMVRIASKNCGRLVRIINDILDIGKLEAGELAVHPVCVPLAALLRQAIEANTIYAAEYGVKLIFSDGGVDGYVAVDPDRLLQVIANLLSNAAKFSSKGASVLVRLLSREAHLRVEVEDFGCGVPEAFRDRIFQKFAQADSSAARPHDGTGLGLSISRKLIEAMGGSIGFSSTVGTGTIFFFELPRLPNPDPGAASDRPVRGTVLG